MSFDVPFYYASSVRSALRDAPADLPAAERFVLALLMLCSGTGGSARVFRSDLARMSGWSESRVSKAMAGLRARGLLGAPVAFSRENAPPGYAHPLTPFGAQGEPAGGSVRRDPTEDLYADHRGVLVHSATGSVAVEEGEVWAAERLRDGVPF